MPKRLSAQETSAFRYQTCTGENGETLYHCPMEIESKADLDNYGITRNDCRTIDFGGTDPRIVYFYRTTNRALAEFQWRSLNRDHSAKVATTRCMIPGIRKTLIRCPTTNACAHCPFGRKVADKQLNIISWDKMVEDACEAEDKDDVKDIPTEETGDFNLLLDAIQETLDREDERLMKALKMKELLGFPVQEIAAQLNCSQPRVYQLVKQAKEMIREILADNE